MSYLPTFCLHLRIFYFRLLYFVFLFLYFIKIIGVIWLFILSSFSICFKSRYNFIFLISINPIIIIIKFIIIIIIIIIIITFFLTVSLRKNFTLFHFHLLSDKCKYLFSKYLLNTLDLGFLL